MVEHEEPLFIQKRIHFYHKNSLSIRKTDFNSKKNNLGA